MNRLAPLPAVLIFAGVTAFAAGPFQPDIVVAADGSGDFKTIQAAVESIPKTNTERMVVLVKNGVYHEKVRVDASFVTLRGQSRSGTRIEFPQLNDDFTKHPDDLGRAVLNLNKANDFVLENLTVANTAGVVGPHAFAVFGTGDRTVVQDCDVLSDGADTVSLWLGAKGRYYHANCRFKGSVDFVCPRGWCYLTNCEFYEMKSGSASVWHDGSKNRDMKFVLRDCRFDGVAGWWLGRHHVDAQFYFLDGTFSRTMADVPIARVIYPDDPQRNANLDKSNVWGEREYFYNCHRAGGDFTWFTNNLAAAPGSPTPQQITAAWTFAGKWNPENAVGPTIQKVDDQNGRVALGFSEQVTVKGKPRLKLDNNAYAGYASGSGTDTLIFQPSQNRPAKVVAVDLNGGAIIASEADTTMREAQLTLPAK